MFADWLWCGHRVWGYSSLLVWFDAPPDALARWLDDARWRPVDGRPRGRG
jgi:hypothetical protein